MTVMKRLIPQIFTIGQRAYLTKNYKDPLYVGDPANIAKILSEFGADEIALVKTDKFDSDHGPDLDLLRKISRFSFTPMSYGGGLRSVDEAWEVLSLGYEKVSFSSAMQKNKSLIVDTVSEVGSSGVIVEITFVEIDDFIKPVDYLSGLPTGNDLSEAVLAAEQTGAGELMLKNINLDGSLALKTWKKYELLEKIPTLVSVPVIYGGGIGSMQDINLIWDMGFEGAAASSFFASKGKERTPMISYPSPMELQDARAKD